MKRGTFLKRVGLVVGGVAVGRHVPLEEVMPIPGPERITNGIFYPEVRATSAMVTNLTASGGLCAPLEPIYDMPAFARPIREALPMFTAERGGMSFPD